MRSTPKVSHASIRCAVVRHRLCEESCEGAVLGELRRPAGAGGPSHDQGNAMAVPAPAAMAEDDEHRNDYPPMWRRNMTTADRFDAVPVLRRALRGWSPDDATLSGSQRALARILDVLAAEFDALDGDEQAAIVDVLTAVANETGDAERRGLEIVDRARTKDAS